jgi:hypothetical protein
LHRPDRALKAGQRRGCAATVVPMRGRGCVAVAFGVMIGAFAPSCAAPLEQEAADERYDFVEPATSEEPTHYEDYVDLARATGETPLDPEQAEQKALQLCNDPPQVIDDPSLRPLGDTLLIRVYCPELDLG